MTARQALFDQWAASYDVGMETGTGSFPFLGYDAVLDRVADEIAATKPATVLELGIDTGSLAQRLRARLPDARLIGVDSSAAMHAELAAKALDVEFLQADLSDGTLPASLPACDAVAATYVLHEFTQMVQRKLLGGLWPTLPPEGVAVLGEVGWPDVARRREAARRFAEHWDPDEHYLAADQLAAVLVADGIHCEWTQVSACGGVAVLRRTPAEAPHTG